MFLVAQLTSEKAVAEAYAGELKTVLEEAYEYIEQLEEERCVDLGKPVSVSRGWAVQVLVVGGGRGPEAILAALHRFGDVMSVSAFGSPLRGLVCDTIMAEPAVVLARKGM